MIPGALLAVHGFGEPFYLIEAMDIHRNKL
jgi:hypothetical protein